MSLYDRLGLASIGLFLLGCVSPLTLAIFMTVSVTTFVGLRLILKYIQTDSKRKRWLYLLIPLQIAPLIWYKYAHFFGNEILHLDQVSFAQIAIPVGISFYTFQLVAFAVDTLVRHEPLPSPVNALNFAGFFPQIVAGPIERRESLLHQLESFRFRWSKSNLEEGLGWIVVGLFFKRCMADNLAIVPLLHDGANAYLVWLDTVLFGFRIYFDFCGYSLMALGVANCLGIRLTLNFRSPYCSTNITDFWRRWHVTLSTWFRDYIYIPMGGGRTRFWTINVMVVFVVSGIWHGAGWNFILWGGLHGIFLIVHRFSKNLKVPTIVCFLITHLGVFFAWLCFYETNTAILLEKMCLLVTPSSYGIESLKEGFRSIITPGGFNVVAMLALIVGVTLLERWSMKEKEREPYFFLRGKGILVILVFLIVFLGPTADNEFIYFAF